MRFPNFRHPLVALIGIWALLLAAPLFSRAEEEASILSGRVIDMEGQPVSDLTLAVQPIDIIEGEMWQMPTPMQQSRTDAAGNFRIKGIAPGHAKLIVLPKRGNFESDTEIYSISVGGLSFLPVDSPNLKIRGNVPLFKGANVDPKKVSAVGGIPLYITSGIETKGITVKVRPRMRIRCQVLLADGSPLTDTAVKLHLHYRSLDGVNSGKGSRSPTYTDSDGYIVMYVNLPAFCTVSVEYEGDTAMGKTFKIGEGQRRHDLVFQLSKASMPPVPNAPTPPPEDFQVPPPVRPVPKQVQAPPVPWMPNPIGAWVVNPTNGHAYKRIQCKSWEDARAKAMAEGAYLVSINDEAEQEWLVEIFGQDPFLIGLTRSADKTEWQWTSGEPVAYANWALRGLAMDRDARVFVSMIDGKWRIGTPETLQRIGIALLEKEVERLDKSLENR